MEQKETVGLDHRPTGWTANKQLWLLCNQL